MFLLNSDHLFTISYFLRRINFWILILLGLLQYNAKCSEIRKKWNLDRSRHTTIASKPKAKINGNWKCLLLREGGLPSNEKTSLILSVHVIPKHICYCALFTICRALCDVISLSWFYWQRVLTSLTFYIVLHCTLVYVLTM